MELPEQIEQHKETRRVGNPNWYPGMESPNPTGRPLGVKSLTAALEGTVDRDAMAVTLWKLAQDDSTPSLQLEAIKYIYARIEGNPIQAMRHQIEGAVGPLIFLHPGKVIEAQSNQELDTPIDAEATEVSDTPPALGSQSRQSESE